VKTENYRATCLLFISHLWGKQRFAVHFLPSPSLSQVSQPLWKY